MLDIYNKFSGHPTKEFTFTYIQNYGVSTSRAAFAKLTNSIRKKNANKYKLTTKIIICLRGYLLDCKTEILKIITRADWRQNHGINRTCFKMAFRKYLAVTYRDAKQVTYA